MIEPNDKEYFYKYYSASSTKLVLSNCSRKWTGPLELNDPFDNQFDLHMDEDRDALAQKLNDKFIKAITSDEAVSIPPIFTGIAEYWKNVLKDSNRELTPEELDGWLEAAKEGVANLAASNERTNQEVRSILEDTTIFCLAETHDNLLMWAHYTKNHTGAVIKFLNVLDMDSPLKLAQPVKYSREMPKMNYENLLDKRDFINNIYNLITLTKSIDWAYEKEWRIVSALRDKSNTSEILPFASEELGAVYLGCKMLNEDKEEIINATTNNFPKAEIYQASKHDKEFKLVFEKIK